MEANLTTQAWTEPLLSLFLRRGRVTGIGPEPVPKIRDVGLAVGGHRSRSHWTFLRVIEP
jgi:hypothetical protein